MPTGTYNQCSGSMTCWCGSGSGSADPCYWLMDPDAGPDPAIFVNDLQDANKKLIFKTFFLLITFWRYIYSVRTKYGTRTNYSEPAYHLCYNAKKTTFREFFFGKLKKEQFERRIFKKRCIFAFKIVKKTFFKNDFFSLIQILPVVYCGGGEISPTLKPNSGSCLEPLPMFPFPWGVIGKIFWKNSWSRDFATTDAQHRTKYHARIKYSACW